MQWRGSSTTAGAPTTSTRAAVVTVLTLYCVVAAVIPAGTAPFVRTSVFGLTLGSLWGAARFKWGNRRLLRFTGPPLLALVFCRLAAPNSTQLWVLPAPGFTVEFSASLVDLGRQILEPGSLQFSAGIEAVIFSWFCVTGALIHRDTAATGTVFRPLLLPVIVASLLSYRLGVRSEVFAVLLAALGATALLAYSHTPVITAIGKRGRDLAGAALLGAVVTGIAFTSGADLFIERGVEPIQQLAFGKVEVPVVSQVQRITLSDTEAAQAWAEKHIQIAEALPGGVEQVLASGRGSEAQRAAVAAALAAEGAVEVTTMSDGSVVWSRPSEGAAPTALVQGGPPAETGTTGAASALDEATSSSTPATGSSLLGGALQSPGSSPDQNNVTAPRQGSSDQVTQREDNQPGSSRTTWVGVFAVALFAVLSTTAVVRRLRTGREVPSSSNHPVVAAWRSADAVLSRRSRVVQGNSRSFRERRDSLSLTDEIAAVHYELTELADRAAFGPGEVDPTRAEELAALVRTTAVRKVR